MKFFCPKTRLLQHNFFFCFLVGTLFLALPALTFAVPGDLDTSFGNGGKVTILIGFWSSANGVIVQADGKIVVAGKDYDKMSLARYNTDGSLDTSFGISGSVTTFSWAI